jgi:Icc-related predicted phosphoesterase
LKFVAISDTHCRHYNLKLPKGDVLIHAGDVTYRGRQDEVEDFLKWFREQPFRYKVFIAGNHDFFFQKTKKETLEKMIPREVIYLNDSGVELEGIKLWGSPITPFFFDWAFNRLRGATINKHWKLIPPDTDILITHGPVFGILDTVMNDRHVGCKDLLIKVKEIKPKVHVCGHIHESYGKAKKGDTLFINACVLNESYEFTNPPVTFQL